MGVGVCGFGFGGVCEVFGLDFDCWVCWLFWVVWV